MGKGIVKLGEGNWAVKDGNLLAAKETNGRFKNAEFTVTRGTDATYVGRDGLIVNETGDNTPRIDFTDNTDGHLLLEPQSTNLVTYSEDFSQWGTSQGTPTPNYGISPDGTQNSTRYVFSGSSQELRENVTTSTNSTGSIYIKGNNGETIKFGVQGSESIFTLNGSWQRIQKQGASASNRITINTYGGATARDIELWGAQLEDLSYATSYIPTNGSTVTRDGETCTGAGEAIDFNSEEGVLYAEIAALETTSSGSNYITITDGTYNNRASILFSSGATNQIRFFLRVGGASQVDKNQSVTNVKSFNKVAFKYKANDFAVWINGVEVSTDTSGSVWTSGTINELNFSEIGTATGAFRGKLKALKVYKEALSDADLQNLTS